MEGVRPATADDLPRLLELYGALAAEMAEYRGRWSVLETWPAPVDEALAAAVADPDVLTLVGTISEYPVGYLTCEIIAALPQAGGERIGKIRDLFVEPDAREVGVGEALLSEAIAWLRAWGVQAADITVSPGHRAAKNFCEENGFVARTITMHSQWE